MRLLVAVLGFNRGASLLRLLESVKEIRAPVGVEIDLLVSLDKSDKQADIVKSLEEFQWEHGRFDVLAHKVRMGLKKHVLYVGDLVKNYDAELMLEDDLYVSQELVTYFTKALDFVERNDSKNDIGGISCYSPQYNESTMRRFSPMMIGSNYYARLPSSWGQGWSRDMWFQFRSWLEESDELDYSNLPDNIRRWSNQSWKKIYTLYLCNTDRYFLYPVVSYSTNVGESGVHMSNINLFQVPLKLYSGHYDFIGINEAACYDSFMDPEPQYLSNYNDCLGSERFVVNLCGLKFVPKNCLQISKFRRNHNLKAWESGFEPEELAITKNIVGTGVFLGKGGVELSWSNFCVLVMLGRNLSLGKVLGYLRRLVIRLSNL